MSDKFGTVAIEHVGIFVKNLEETSKWYEELFGFEPQPFGNGMAKAGVFPKCRRLRLGNFDLEVYELVDGEDFSFREYEYRVGLKHLNFYIEKFDEFSKYVHKRGDITILVENLYPEKLSGVPGGDKVLYILDCNGMLVEVSSSRNGK